MVGYLRVFLHVLRVAALMGVFVSAVVTLVVVLDLFGLSFGYPWWAILVTVPTVLFFWLIARGAKKALKAG
jgi:hypothetical protein